MTQTFIDTVIGKVQIQQKQQMYSCHNTTSNETLATSKSATHENSNLLKQSKQNLMQSA